MLRFLVSFVTAFLLLVGSTFAQGSNTKGNCSPIIGTAQNVVVNCNNEIVDSSTDEEKEIISISGFASYQFGSERYKIRAQSDLALGCRIRLYNPKGVLVAGSDWIPEGGQITLKDNDFIKKLKVVRVAWLTCDLTAD